MRINVGWVVEEGGEADERGYAHLQPDQGARNVDPAEERAVIGIRAAGRWTGELERRDGTKLYVIRQCDSPLAIRMASVSRSKRRDHGTDHAARRTDLGADILLRLANAGFFQIDSGRSSGRCSRRGRRRPRADGVRLDRRICCSINAGRRVPSGPWRLPRCRDSLAHLAAQEMGLPVDLPISPRSSNGASTPRLPTAFATHRRPSGGSDRVARRQGRRRRGGDPPCVTELDVLTSCPWDSLRRRLTRRRGQARAGRPESSRNATWGERPWKRVL